MVCGLCGGTSSLLRLLLTSESVCGSQTSLWEQSDCRDNRSGMETTLLGEGKDGSPLVLMLVSNRIHGLRGGLGSDIVAGG